MLQSRRNFLKLLGLGCPAAYVAAKAGPLLVAPQALPVAELTALNFHALLNAYFSNEMLMRELLKKDYLLARIPKDADWQGGTVSVPFLAEK